MTKRNIVYPLPLAFFSNGKIRFGRLPVLKEKYEYPLSDIVSIHKYTCDGGDEFTYYTTLNFGKTNTYFLAQWSRTERENQQVIEILSGFLAVPLGNDLNKKKVGFSNPLLSLAFDNIFNPERLKEEQSQIILWFHAQKIAVSSAMMLEENQHRLTKNENDPEANLMVGLAFMGMKLFDAATEKLQKSKKLYEQIGQKENSVKVQDYLELLQIHERNMSKQPK